MSHQYTFLKIILLNYFRDIEKTFKLLLYKPNNIHKTLLQRFILLSGNFLRTIFFLVLLYIYIIFLRFSNTRLYLLRIRKIAKRMTSLKVIR